MRPYPLLVIFGYRIRSSVPALIFLQDDVESLNKAVLKCAYLSCIGMSSLLLCTYHLLKNSMNAAINIQRHK